MARTHLEWGNPVPRRINTPWEQPKPKQVEKDALKSIPADELALVEPAEIETPEQDFALAVGELLNQAFDRFGLSGNDTITRVKKGPDGKIIEHLDLARKDNKGMLILYQPQPQRDIYLNNMQDTHATYMNAQERSDGAQALGVIHKALISSSVVIKT